jgi:hypothetical protein
LSGEALLRGSSLCLGSVICVVGVSRYAGLTAAALFLGGGMWAITWSTLDTTAQMSAPKWIVGRCIAASLAAGWGAIALGSVFWGFLAVQAGIESSLVVAGVLTALCALAGLWSRMRLPDIEPLTPSPPFLQDPEVMFRPAGEDGPVVIEIEYRIKVEDTSPFLVVMQSLRSSRQRGGGHDWSISRDVADPELWIERYRCPTWHDYLRHRNRSTETEIALANRARALHAGPDQVQVRRLLMHAS